MGCKCQECERVYYVDFNVVDELWEKIKPEGAPKGGGLLCGTCITRKLDELFDRENKDIGYFEISIKI